MTNSGTGKTVISALDYKRFRKQNAGQPCRLLFVAHREEILKQSLYTFRAVLKDANFGEMFVGSYKPDSIDNLFISIQTFNSQDFTSKTTPDFYDYIIVDEFHHAAAPTYQKLLAYYGGRIGKQSYEKAAEYYEIGAGLGNAWSQENLGYVWYYGRTGEKNYEKAFNCFVKGALAGRPISMFKVGDMYKNGYYVEKDLRTAFSIYKRCEENLGDFDNMDRAGADVYMRLGDCYFEGLGTQKNIRKALEYYQKAEPLFLERLENGDYFYKGTLKHVLENEDKCKETLIASLPDFDWVSKARNYDKLKEE